MNRAITLAQPLARAAAATGRTDVVDLARSLVVLGSAAALILARQPLPF